MVGVWESVDEKEYARLEIHGDGVMKTFPKEGYAELSSRYRRLAIWSIQIESKSGDVPPEQWVPIRGYEQIGGENFSKTVGTIYVNLRGNRLFLHTLDSPGEGSVFRRVK